MVKELFKDSHPQERDTVTGWVAPNLSEALGPFKTSGITH